GVVNGVWQGWLGATQYTVGVNSGGVAIGELDGHLGLDIAVSNTGNLTATTPSSGSITILTNDGLGTFVVQPAISVDALAVAGSAPRGILITELEGGLTSFLDIAVALSGHPNLSLVLENHSTPLGFEFEPCPIPTGPGSGSVSGRNLDPN